MSGRHTPGPWRVNGLDIQAKLNPKKGDAWFTIATAKNDFLQVGSEAVDNLALLAAGPDLLAELDKLKEEFSTYKEASEQVFGEVVEAKHAIEARIAQLEQTIQSQQGVIVKMRGHRDELLAALNEIAKKGVTTGYGRTALANIASAIIAKVKGGAL